MGKLDTLNSTPGRYDTCPRCGEWVWFLPGGYWATENGKRHDFRSCWMYRVPELTEGWVTAHVLLTVLTLWAGGGWLWVALLHAYVDWRRKRMK